jgi:hypothetical protein
MLLAAVGRLLDGAAIALGTEDALLREFPFLGPWREALIAAGGDPAAGRAAQALEEKAAALEGAAGEHLPLRALRRAAALDAAHLTMLLATGLVEEDARFGALFSALQGTPHLLRPTAGLLETWWRGPDADGRGLLRRLAQLGLLEVGGGDLPRTERPVQVPALLWDALRGGFDGVLAPWVRHLPLERLAREGPLVLPETAAAWLEPLPALMAAAEIQAVIVRGPRHGGRGTVLRALARALGRGALEVEAPADAYDARWRLVGPLATLLHALPVVRLAPAAGDAAEVPELQGADVAAGIVVGRKGGVTGAGVARAVTVELAPASPAERAAHWEAALGSPGPRSGELARFRMTSGHIRRAAVLARSHAALRGAAAVAVEDVRAACRSLHRQELEALAAPLDARGDFGDLAVTGETLRELRHLEARCRLREALPMAVGDALARSLTPGVRALFQGPSGTGKTLAARALAAALEMDLYRVDLAAVVNKYIGETEKNLSRVFGVAEDLDVVLLLDEGDALLARRTQVGNANDRYANLETNFLLQRIEAYEGILLVTTNAADLVDGAFQRRMDVVISFRPPDPAERWAIWQLHLPPGHGVEAALLHRIASRCALTGGQIRNAVLHASVLALDQGGPVGSAHVEAAVEREYRKSGGTCPLRAAARS